MSGPSGPGTVLMAAVFLTSEGGSFAAGGFRPVANIFLDV